MKNETLEERLQREAKERFGEIRHAPNRPCIELQYTVKDHFYQDINTLISHTISETIKEAVKVIKGEKLEYENEGTHMQVYNQDLITALTAVEGLQDKKE